MSHRLTDWLLVAPRDSAWLIEKMATGALSTHLAPKAHWDGARRGHKGCPAPGTAGMLYIVGVLLYVIARAAAKRGGIGMLYIVGVLLYVIARE